jgi:hypothetical protein
MRGYAAMVLVLATLAVGGAVGNAAAAGGETPVTVPLLTNELSVDVGFSPKALPKSEQTPISLAASGEISDPTDGHPQVLRELTMEFDKAVEIHADGIPSCRRGHLGGDTKTVAALNACRSALIGEGEATVQVAYAESEPVNVRSRLLVFKGGERDGKTTLFIHAYFSNPISAAVVMPVTIARHTSRFFGTRAIAKIPQIADGYGSITKFNFEISKEVEVEGKYLNPISATCSDRELRVHALGRFEDGEKVETEVIRSCTTAARSVQTSRLAGDRAGRWARRGR